MKPKKLYRNPVGAFLGFMAMADFFFYNDDHYAPNYCAKYLGRFNMIGDTRMGVVRKPREIALRKPGAFQLSIPRRGCFGGHRC